jgi:lipopolysaccharide export system protein LptA
MNDTFTRMSMKMAALSAAFLLAAPAFAQTPTFGGLSENSDEPIDIQSDVLVVHDSKKYATFKGNVVAVQGTTTLRSLELDVHYVGGREKLSGAAAAEAAKTAKPETTPSSEAATPTEPGTVPVTVKEEDGTKIVKIEAKGNVVITSEDDQTTTSDWALYDVPTQMVTVGGNVVLMQGQNVLKGDRLVIDLKTGESRFENKGNTVAGGRIRALFMPKDTPAEPEDGKPRKKKPAAENDGSEPAAAEEVVPLPALPEPQ